jgi:hypothetical protein
LLRDQARCQSKECGGLLFGSQQHRRLALASPNFLQILEKAIAE